MFQANGNPAGHVAEHGEAERAVAVHDVQPRTGGGGALLNAEAVRAGLAQLGVAPDRHGDQGIARLRGKVGEVGQALAVELRVVEPGDFRPRRSAITRHHSHRLIPDALAIADEPEVAVVQFLLERHGEREAETLDEILAAVAVINE